MKKAARSDVFLEGAAFFCGRGACFAAGRAGQSEFGFFWLRDENSFPLFRVMEIHRICEVTATPFRKVPT